MEIPHEPQGLPWLNPVRSESACCCLVTNLCLTLLQPPHRHPPGSSVPGIFQARILEWVAISLFLKLIDPWIIFFSPAESCGLHQLGALAWESVGSGSRTGSATDAVAGCDVRGVARGHQEPSQLQDSCSLEPSTWAGPSG